MLGAKFMRDALKKQLPPQFWLWIVIGLVPVAIWVRFVPWPLWSVNFAYEFLGAKWVSPSTRRRVRRWLAKHIDHCAAAFERLEFIRSNEHTFYVAAPISIGGKMHTHASDTALASLFTDAPRPILITGEGGSGKTSLAFQICRWAIAPRTSISSTRRRLPVLIRPSDQFNGSLVALIERRLREAYSIPESPWFATALLEEGAVLLVIDDIQERPIAERQAIYAAASELRNTVMIATSRSDDEALDVRHRIETLDVPPEQTQSFISSYVKASGHSTLADEQVEQAAAEFNRLTNDLPANAFLIKLYCDQWIRNGFTIEATSASTLIQDYLRRVIRHHVAREIIDEESVYRACKSIARECLRENRFSPGPLHRSNAIFRSAESAGLRQLCGVRLLIELEDDPSYFQFSSKTFALYAAAISYIEDTSLQLDDWRSLLRTCSETSFRPEEFLTALGLASRTSPGLHPDIRRAIAEAAGAESEDAGQRIEGTGFIVAGRLSQSAQRAPNGVMYELYDVRKEEDVSERALAKCYLLGKGDAEALQEMKHRAARHAEVCELIRRASPHVHRYLTTGYDAARRRLWVIQEWLDGRSLASIDLAKVRSNHRAIMRDIGRGLSALHDNGVVVRTLSPESVYLDRCSGAAVLTNFEMARILGAKSVSANTVLTDNPFVAPELVCDPSLRNWSPEEQRKVDIYSWAAVYVYLLTGKPPSFLGDEGDIGLESAQISEQSRALLQRCLGPVSERPASINEALATLAR